MSGVIATIPKFQFSANGVPMVGGTLDTYIAGSTTPATTWQDSALTIANTNPISLDARGECVLWLDPAVVYKFVLKNSQGVIQWTQDNISNPAALANSLRADLAAATGASLVGFQQDGTGALARTAQDKMRERVSVLDFGADPSGVADSTAAIQKAIDAASTAGKHAYVPAGTYKLVPATAKTDEAGANTAALLMRSGMHIDAEPGAVFRIADNISTDAAPLRHSMFFSNEFLSNISIVGLTMDMNGQNNKISPNRSSLLYNKFTNAQVIFSGTPGGVAAGANNVLIEKCTFRNNAGVSCIVMAQSNSVGTTLGTSWRVLNNRFENVGLDTDDHSCVFGWATDVLVQGNSFVNPAPFNSTTNTGGLVAYEIHGSNTRFVSNHIKNFYQGVWASINLTEGAVQKLVISNNTAEVSQVFLDFYSANSGTGASSESAIADVAVIGNVITILNAAVADQIKAVFKVAARNQPSRVAIKNNVCRNLDTTKSACLVLIPVVPDQLGKADQISISGNVASGLQAGLVCYFGGTGGTDAKLNIGRVEFSNNSLGFLIAAPDGLLSNNDVSLYGASAGKAEELRVYGLEHPTKPILTDAAAGGRAVVLGKTILDLPVTWSGVTIGNGSYSKKIALDTDSGHAVVDVGFIAGATTTFSGSIAPTITGLVADSTATAAATHLKVGAALVLPSIVFSAASAISLYSASGSLFDSSQTTTDSYVFVNSKFPCRSASI